MGEVVHRYIDHPNPIKWLAMQSFPNVLPRINLALNFDKVLQKLVALHFHRLIHVVEGVVFVPIKV